MKVARTVILIVALGSGLGAALLASRMMNAPETAPAPIVVREEPRLDMADVLVVSRDVAMGSTLKAGDLQWQPLPKTSVTDAYVTRSAKPNAPTDLVGTVARKGFLPGEPVHEAQLMKTDRGFMSVILSPGMRALAVEIKAASSAGGFILPNDHVDIILTRAAAKGGQGGDAYVSETILTNIRVLAIDQLVTEKGEPSVVARDTATLEVTPRQAETIAQAQQLGTISLVLRSIRAAEVSAVEDDDKKGESGAIRVVRYGVTTRVTTPR